MENAEVLMLKNSCITLEYNYFSELEFAFSIKWKNAPICCILFSKLEKNASKLPKV